MNVNKFAKNNVTACCALRRLAFKQHVTSTLVYHQGAYAHGYGGAGLFSRG